MTFSPPSITVLRDRRSCSFSLCLPVRAGASSTCQDGSGGSTPLSAALAMTWLHRRRGGRPFRCGDSSSWSCSRPTLMECSPPWVHRHRQGGKLGKNREWMQRRKTSRGFSGIVSSSDGREGVVEPGVAVSRGRQEGSNSRRHRMKSFAMLTKAIRVNRQQASASTYRAQKPEYCRENSSRWCICDANLHVTSSFVLDERARTRLLHNEFSDVRCREERPPHLHGEHDNADTPAVIYRVATMWLLV